MDPNLIASVRADEDFNVPVEHLPYAAELKTPLPYTESRLRTEIIRAVGQASACWSNLPGAGIFDDRRAIEVADKLIDKVIDLTGLGQPSLGCASTAELLAELTTRMMLDELMGRPLDVAAPPPIAQP